MHHAITPKLTVGKSYKVMDLNEETDILVVNDAGNEESFDAMRFKLVEEKIMNKQQAQQRIEAMRQELAELEEIVNTPDEPKFKPFTVEISDPKVALYLFVHLGSLPYGSDTSDFYTQIRNEFEEQSGHSYTGGIIAWLQSQA